MGIGLFARGTTGNPDADRRIGGPIFEDARINHTFQGPERFWFPKKRRHGDQDIAVEQPEFLGVCFQRTEVPLWIAGSAQDYAPLDAPAQRAPFIKLKIDSLGGPQKLDDFVESFFALGFVLYSFPVLVLIVVTQRVAELFSDLGRG